MLSLSIRPKQSALLWFLLFFTAGCAHRILPPLPPAITAHYPFSEIERIYDIVLVTMLERHAEANPNENAQSIASLDQFVRTSISRSEFGRQMTKGLKPGVFDRASADILYRDSEEFRRELTVCGIVSTQMAPIIIRSRFDVYRRKIADPDPLSQSLFAIARNSDEEDCVAWLTGEVAVAQVKTELGDKLSVSDGDRFFAFSSPGWFWEQLAGRQGYIQVRDREIVAVHVTMMN